MKTSTLIRLSGISSILAGCLRTLASFVPFLTHETSVRIELFYLVIDILILFGLIGIYVIQHEKSGLIGFAGFLMAMTGTALIVGPDGKIGSVDIYTTGASIISVGMLLLAIGSLKAGVLSRRAPILWIVSTLVGIVGFTQSGKIPDYSFFLAGITFGLAFLFSGFEVWKKQWNTRPY